MKTELSNIKEVDKVIEEILESHKKHRKYDQNKPKYKNKIFKKTRTQIHFPPY